MNTVTAHIKATALMETQLFFSKFAKFAKFHDDVITIEKCNFFLIEK